MEIEFPSTDDSLLIRTDFSDDDAWRAVCAAASALTRDHEFQAYLECIDDRQLDGATVDTLLALVPYDYFFVADTRTMTDPEHPILAVDNGDPELGVKPGTTFRVVPSELYGPENNLSEANMDFEEFANATDADGVFRGFN